MSITEYTSNYLHFSVVTPVECLVTGASEFCIKISTYADLLTQKYIKTM